MNVVIFGATGMIGQGVLHEAIRDPDVKRIVSVVRRSTGQSDPKVREVVCEDMWNFAPVEAELRDPRERRHQRARRVRGQRFAMLHAFAKIRQEGSDCFLDLPPHTDLSVPIDLAGEFGMLPMTYRLSEAPGGCDAGAGWERTATPNTVRVCGQACSVFALAAYTVTLECNAPSSSDAG